MHHRRRQPLFNEYLVRRNWRNYLKYFVLTKLSQIFCALIYEYVYTGFWNKRSLGLKVLIYKLTKLLNYSRDCSIMIVKWFYISLMNIWKQKCVFACVCVCRTPTCISNEWYARMSPRRMTVETLMRTLSPVEYKSSWTTMQKLLLSTMTQCRTKELIFHLSLVQTKYCFPNSQFKIVTGG